jgi:hypothetical protein
MDYTSSCRYYSGPSDQIPLAPQVLSYCMQWPPHPVAQVSARNSCSPCHLTPAHRTTLAKAPRYIASDILYIHHRSNIGIVEFQFKSKERRNKLVYV